jgi:uncharacterized SAM-binding protein YcdF (DUF218 family)
LDGQDVQEAVTGSRARQAAQGALLGGAAALLSNQLGLPAAVSYWGSRPLLVLLAAAAGALLALSRLRALVVAVASLLALLWLAVAYTPLCGALARGLVRSEPPVAADAVVVLGSDLQPDGDLSSSAQTRLLRAVALLRAGHAPRLVLTEFRSRVRHAVAAAPLLAELGVAVEVVAVGPVGNTRDEAVVVARLFRERGLARALVVTSPLHTRRAAAAFEQAGIEVRSVPAVETRYDVEGLATAEDRLRAFGDVLHERVGLLVYRWRGWLP